MEVGGIPIHLVDTAGLRSGGDCVEQQGVARTLRAIEQADVVIAVLDLSTEWDEADRQLIRDLDRSRSIVVANKKDLVPEAGWEERLRSFLVAIDVDAADENESTPRWCAVSAMTGEGLDALRKCIQSFVTQGDQLQLEEPILANERQRQLVADALNSTGAAVTGIRARAGEELVCEDIREAAGALGRITGEDLTEDLLDEIFSRFCLGK